MSQSCFNKRKKFILYTIHVPVYNCILHTCIFTCVAYVQYMYIIHVRTEILCTNYGNYAPCLTKFFLLIL